MSGEGREESARELLLAEVYAQPEAGARDRARAVERFMEARAKAQARGRPRRRALSRRIASAAATVAACAVSASLGWNAWRSSGPVERASEATPVPETVAPPAVVAETKPVAPVASSERAAVPSAPGRRLPSSEEITVTARKREENLQSTPVAISAFSEADLEEQDIRSVQEITKSVPNLQFDTAIGSGNSARIYLRGVGNGDPLSSDDPVDGIYVDGVYYPRAPDAPVVGSAPPAAAPAGPSQLESPITLLPPSAERLRELEGERGNDMAEVLPALGSATMDPCAEPERVGAAVPAESAEEATRATRCRTVER